MNRLHEKKILSHFPKFKLHYISDTSLGRVYSISDSKNMRWYIWFNKDVLTDILPRHIFTNEDIVERAPF